MNKYCRWLRIEKTDGYGNPRADGHFARVFDAADDGLEVGLLRFFRSFPNGAKVAGRPSDAPIKIWLLGY